MHLKLTYLLLGIALLASSCNSDADIKLSKGTELSFDVSNAFDLSRGSVATSINQFVVYGDLKPVSSENSSPVVLFDKTNVEYKNGSWGYNGTQYWIPDCEHSFVALSPGAILDNGGDSQYLNSHLSFEYSIPASGNVVDILTATHRRLYVDKESDKITFSFNHLLSLINIAPAYDDKSLSSEDYIMFHKLEISGVSTKAQVDIMPAPMLTGSSTYDMEFDIDAQEPGAYSIDFPTPVEVQNKSPNVSLFASDDAIIMLPQAFASDSDAEITLSYTIGDDNSIKFVNIPLKGLEWESGRSYLYRFTISRSGVIFDGCEINPWNDIEPEQIEVY